MRLLPFWDTHGRGRAPRRKGWGARGLSSGPCSPRRRVPPALAGLLLGARMAGLVVRDSLEAGTPTALTVAAERKNATERVGWTSWLQSDGPGRSDIAYLGSERVGGDPHRASREYDLAVCAQNPAPPVRRQEGPGPTDTVGMASQQPACIQVVIQSQCGG